MPAAAPRIAVITINWNRAGLTRQCLYSLAACEGVDWHLFVVDNGSTDNSVQELSDLGPNVTLIETGINSGWAGGNNKGLSVAASKYYDWFFLLNNDATVEPQTLRELWKSATRHKSILPIVGAVQLDRDPAACFYGRQQRMNSVLSDDMTASTFRKQNILYETAFIKGAAIFFNRNHLESLGNFDERFFLNYEESDWCARARKVGFPVLMNKKAVVHHAGSGSMGGLSSPMSTYFLVRNALLYAEMHGGIKGVLETIEFNLSWARAHHSVDSNARAIVRALRSKGPWATAWKAGMRDYALRRFGDCPPIIRRLTYATKPPTT